MPNRSILGGSPLGIIGVKSWYGSDGLSTYNAGRTRNIKVPEYNTNETGAGKMAGLLYGNSLFSGYRVVRAWPNIDPIGEGAYDTKGTKSVKYNDVKEKDGTVKPGNNKGDTSTRRTLHSNDVYDTSILNIIEKLAGTKAALRPADFAYLKNVGVYPNNRLMIARRFAGPSDDNIMVPKRDSDLGSFATLISWKGENEDFLDITFGEEWVEAPADFKGILTSLGEDIGLGNLGGISGAAGNALPLPGFTEIFQRQFLASLELIENSSKDSIPAGNPNLIKQAKMRKTIGYSEAGSGLKCTVNIKMVCEYELKYISGIDPTIVWMDLLGMITRFGTSNSETYGLSAKVSAKLISWVNNPNQLISEAADALSNAIEGIITEITAAIKKAYDSAVTAANKLAEDEKTQEQNKSGDGEPQKEKKGSELAMEAANKQRDEQNIWASALSATLRGVKTALYGLLQKYRVKIIGIVNALSGLPSTPWHITIGNPMRPVFCAGDMLVENVNLKLGPVLAFNDLPSSITVEFNLTNARPWGLQEIMAKFNSGYLRTVDVQKSFYETNQIKVPRKDDPTKSDSYPEIVGVLPFNDVVYGTQSGSSGTSGNTGNNSTNNSTTPQSGGSGTTGTSGGSTGTSGVPNASDVTKAENGNLPKNPPDTRNAGG